MPEIGSPIRRPRAASVSYDARQVAKAYGCPIDKFDGTGVTVGIVELGGGYNATDVAKQATDLHITPAGVTVVGVDGGRSTSDGPNGADGEVMLDVEVIAAVAPGAKQRVYFAPNTDAGFLDAITQAAAECDYVSISWGGPENSWDAATIDAYETVLSAARARGVTVFVASGDTGSQDSGGDGRNHVDFPASSPSVVGCGGTRLTLNAAGSRAAEVVWNDGATSSATGGGVSAHFPGRQVPDVAGNADPETGYKVYVDGGTYIIGGTSAVAPLFAAMTAVVRQAYGKPFDFLNALLTNPAVCFDVTSGNNGGFKAGPGRDQTTGFGVPDMGKLLAVLVSGAQVPAPGGGTPPPVVPPVVPPAPASTPPVDVQTWAQRTVKSRWSAKSDRKAAQEYLDWLAKQ